MWKLLHHNRMLTGLLAVLALTGLLWTTAAAAGTEQAEEENIIWVAGNPDLFPLEYYDAETGDYAGAIPDVLRQVAKQKGLDLRYREPSFLDHRAELCGQVQIVSGLVAEEGESWGLTGRSTCFATVDVPGGEKGVYLGWTEQADPETVSALKTGILELPKGELSNLLLTHIRSRHIGRLELILGAVLLVALVLLGLVIYQMIHHRRVSARQQKLLTDPGTGLGSLTYFKETCQQKISPKDRIRYCIIYFGTDVERLQVFYGPDGAMEQLARLADLLQEHCESQDVLTRFGANCFAMARLTTSREENERWLRHFFRHLWDAYSDPKLPNTLRFHAGLYYLDEEIEEEGDPCSDPIAALFHARQGYLYAVRHGLDFSETGAEEVQAKACRDQNLRDSQEALDEEQFKIYLQPMVNTHSGRIVGAEALSRWQHPTRGLLGPDQFIDMMVREGMIYKLDYYVLERVCRLLQMLAQKGLGDIFITCNFSPATLDEPDVLDRVKAVVGQYEFDRKRLVVEVTEEVVSRNPDTYQRNLEALRDMGLSTALDDFGSGYTSFSELSTHSFNILKIDQSLLRNVTLPYGRAILSGLIDFTRRLNLEVLCEGVEEIEQAELLAGMGCDLLQGFYFSKPLPAQEVCRLFETCRQAPPVMGEGAVRVSSLL